MEKMFLPSSTACVQQLHRHARQIHAVMSTGKLLSMAMAFLMVSTCTGLENDTESVLGNGTTPGSDLSFFYYNRMCPQGFGNNATSKFQNLTDALVAPRIAADPGLAPALMRLAFHDCFVEGCDASVLLNSAASNLPAEKESFVNLSLRGFEVIDAVKAALELVCPGVFSCADILQEVALAAQRYMPGQPDPKATWKLRYGRRDGRVSLAANADQFLPTPFMNYAELVENFAAQGLNQSDLVHLSGAHTFGIARCVTFTQRLYNFSGNGSGIDPALDATLAANLKVQCPLDSPSNLVNLDVTTPSTFENDFYNNIPSGKVLFTSDDALKNAPLYIKANAASNPLFVTINFANSFTTMTEIKVKLFPSGEIRSNCSIQN